MRLWRPIRRAARAGKELRASDRSLLDEASMPRRRDPCYRDPFPIVVTLAQDRERTLGGHALRRFLARPRTPRRAGSPLTATSA